MCALPPPQARYMVAKAGAWAVPWGNAWPDALCPWLAVAKVSAQVALSLSLVCGRVSALGVDLMVGLLCMLLGWRGCTLEMRIDTAVKRA